MNKNVKIYFLITMFFLISLLFIMNTECYASSCINVPKYFVSFDGKEYENSINEATVSSLIDSGCTHYIVLTNYHDGGKVPLRYIGFKSSVHIQYNEDGSFSLLTDGGNFGYYCNYGGNLSFNGTGYLASYEFTSDYSVIYGCDCMAQYKDRFSSDFFGRPLPMGQGTLPQITQEARLEGVLQEIVEILPVVLLIIVGLIGLRKALAFLQKVLYRS